MGNLLVSKVYIGLIEELQVIMVMFIKYIFLIGYLIYRIYLTMRIFVMREKLNLLCINLESMPYVCEKEYRLIKSENVKKKIVHG